MSNTLANRQATEVILNTLTSIPVGLTISTITARVPPRLQLEKAMVV
jgi:hypothetical protein